MKHYLGMYDISCHKLRYRVFKLLTSFGIHHQKSVFECALRDDKKRQLIQQLQLITQDQQKRIVLIRIFPNHSHTVMFGQAKRMPSSTCLYIG